MRALLWLLLIFLFCSWGGQVQAFSGSNCPIYWKAFVLPEDESSGRDAFAADPARRSTAKILFALTAVPPKDTYLYGTASKEGLPTELQAFVAPLTAFPMTSLSDKDIASLVLEKGDALTIRAPAAPLKKDTPFASVLLQGGADSNPPIYPGPFTFWVEFSAPTGGLGGVALQASLSGLFCSAASCSPASGTLSLALSAEELRALPPAQEQAWWQDWKQGENVFVEPPESVLAEPFPLSEEASFAGGRSLTPSASKADGQMRTGEYDATAYASHVAFFSSFAPDPFNPGLEVQYLGEALLFGLAAGLLLNLMPCVLPVVSLKFSALMAVSTMEDKKRQARAFRTHCLIFALGIMTWFIALAMLLGMAGWAWGEIFQQPGVIVILAIVLFLLGLSLFGVYTLPLFDLKLSRNSHPHWHAFGSGLLATLLATPCSGPLLGGVLAWAIRQELPVLMLTITSIGMGMSLPYGVLAFFPQLVHLLPRPGAWTLRLEQLLGFFLMGSVVYLTTLLPAEWIPAFLFNLFAVALAAWLWGQIGHLRASRLRRGISRTLAIALVVLTSWWGGVSILAQEHTSWENFDPERFMELVGKEAMLLEFTADWCPSCKALEHTTLSEKRMAELRSRYNLRTIRVDLTRKDTVGGELLKALDSTSIPVIALFPKGEGARRPVVLRDLVTSAQLEEAAKRVF